MAKFARQQLPPLLRCSIPRCDFKPTADDLLSVRSCCLANVLPAPRFPCSRPHSASFRSCLLLPPGFLGKREADTCAKAVRVSPSFSSIFLLLLIFCNVNQAAIEKCLFMRCGNVTALQIHEMVFGVSHIPGAYTVLDHLFWVRLSAQKKKCRRLVALCLVP